jgi:Fe2+ transport system protein FeoA
MAKLNDHDSGNVEEQNQSFASTCCGSGMGKQHRHRCRAGCYGAGKKFDNEDILPLSELHKGASGVVCCNPDKKTKVIGINPGRHLVVFKNESYEPNLIVSLESTRYIIAKSIACNIYVIKEGDEQKNAE